MNRKEATLFAIPTMAIFATVMTTSSSTQALASVDDASNNGVASDGVDTSGTTYNTNENENGEDITESANGNRQKTTSDGTADDRYSSGEAEDDLQACLSDNGVKESPTEQEVQDCMDPNYNGRDDNDSQSGNTDNDDEDETENTEDDDDSDSEEEDEWE